MEVIYISESIPVNDGNPQSHKRTVGDAEMTVHNVEPTFKTKEAQNKEKEEIAHTLYRIFSKYNGICP